MNCSSVAASSTRPVSDPVVVFPGVARTGKGREAVVFIHGWTCDLTFWREQAPLYEKRRALSAGLAAVSLSAPARGEDLMQIYREAVTNDPAIASAQANWQATQEAVPQAEPAPKTEAPETEAPKTEAPAGLPEGYEEMTVAQVKAAAAGWTPEELEAAHAYENEHAARKGAIAALESAQAKEES